MKVETLLICAVIMVFLGGLLGGGYAYLNSNDLVADVPDIIPTKQSEEEELIEEFIAKQEELHPDGIDDIAISSNDKKDNDKKTESEDKPKTDSDLGDNQEMGQPTVSDGVPLNVRSGPSKEDKVITMVYNTDKIVLLSKQNGWYHIQTSEGIEGFVSAEYVKVVN